MRVITGRTGTQYSWSHSEVRGCLGTTIIRKMNQSCPCGASGYLRPHGIRKRVLELVGQAWAQILHFHLLCALFEYSLVTVQHEQQYLVQTLLWENIHKYLE